MEERELIVCDVALIKRVIDAAFVVHTALGPGLLESVYELALMAELEALGIPARNQVEVAVSYRGKPLGTGFRADIIVAGCLLLEIKAVESIHPIHQAQLITYLKLLGIKRGYLLNFNSKFLRDGIRRISILFCRSPCSPCSPWLRSL